MDFQQVSIYKSVGDSEVRERPRNGAERSLQLLSEVCGTAAHLHPAKTPSY